MRLRTRSVGTVLAATLLMPLASCDVLEGFFDFFGRGVTIVIENDTSFTAVPDLRRSESGNIIGDILGSDTRIEDFGDGGKVRPKSTVSVRLACDDDLGSLIFGAVQFREGNGFTVGAASAGERLRQGNDFECGDTIYLRLSGSIFTFHADVEVAPAMRLRPSENEDEEEDDFADWLDGLFD